MSSQLTDYALYLQRPQLKRLGRLKTLLDLVLVLTCAVLVVAIVVVKQDGVDAMIGLFGEVGAPGVPRGVVSWWWCVSLCRVSAAVVRCGLRRAALIALLQAVPCGVSLTQCAVARCGGLAWWGQVLLAAGILPYLLSLPIKGAAMAVHFSSSNVCCGPSGGSNQNRSKGGLGLAFLHLDMQKALAWIFNLTFVAVGLYMVVCVPPPPPPTQLPASGGAGRVCGQHTAARCAPRRVEGKHRW